MPIYVYKNLVTNETFEFEQRITEDALTTDPSTGDPVKRLIQPVGIAFKGSGFYINDSRGSKSGGLKSPPAASASGDGASGEGAAKSEATNADSSKPASSEASKPAATGSATSTSATSTAPAAS